MFMQKLDSKNPNLNIQFKPISLDKSGDLGSLFVVEYYLSSNQAKKTTIIANQDTLDTLKEGGTDINEHHYMLVKSSTLDMIKKYGKLPFLAALDKQSTVKEFSKNPVEDINNNEFEIIELVENPNHKLAWKDKSLTLHCEPFILTGHIMSELDDAHYYLDDFAEALSKRSDVAFIIYTERWSEREEGLLFAPLRGDEKGIGGVINEISHHLEDGDAEPEEKEEINLVFYPNSNNLEQVLFFDCDKEGRLPENKNRKVYYVERFIVRDILGGAEFYIEPEKPEVTPQRKFKH
jgi:hypothetical protein